MSLHHPMGRACYPPVRTGTARDSKRVRIAIPRDSAGLLEGREACKLCHWNHPHAYQGHYSPCGRARHLLLDTARASNPFAAFIEMTVRVSSFKAGSVWCHGVGFAIARFHRRGRAVGLLPSRILRCSTLVGYSSHQRYASALTLTLPLHFGIPKEWWREWFAVPGPIAVGGTAWPMSPCRPAPLPDRARRLGLFCHHDDRWR